MVTSTCAIILVFFQYGLQPLDGGIQPIRNIARLSLQRRALSASGSERRFGTRVRCRRRLTRRPLGGGFKPCEGTVQPSLNFL